MISSFITCGLQNASPLFGVLEVQNEVSSAAISSAQANVCLLHSFGQVWARQFFTPDPCGNASNGLTTASLVFVLGPGHRRRRTGTRGPVTPRRSWPSSDAPSGDGEGTLRRWSARYIVSSIESSMVIVITTSSIGSPRREFCYSAAPPSYNTNLRYNAMCLPPF